MKEQRQTAGETAMQTFTFNPSNQPIRVEMIDNEPWFVAKDVCDALQLTDVSMTVSRLDDDEKLTQTLLVSGQGRQMWLVNESGLYNLIFQSRKAEAKASTEGQDVQLGPLAAFMWASMARGSRASSSR